MANKIAISADTDTRAYMYAMNKIQKDNLPKAAAATLNRIANAVTVEQKRNVKGDFTIRTPFTMRSMESPRAKPFKALNKAGGRNLERMFSRAGTMSNYLWTQEDDQTLRGRDGNMPIATTAARTGRSLNKSIRRTYRLSGSQSLKDGPIGAKQFIGRPKGGSRRRGLYVRSGNNQRLTMIRNLENKSVRIKGTHFHKKAVEKHGNRRTISAAFRFEARKYLRRGI